MSEFYSLIQYYFTLNIQLVFEVFVSFYVCLRYLFEGQVKDYDLEGFGQISVEKDSKHSAQAPIYSALALSFTESAQWGRMGGVLAPICSALALKTDGISAVGQNGQRFGAHDSAAAPRIFTQQRRSARNSVSRRYDAEKKDAF